jgi:hypothetical protein
MRPPEFVQHSALAADVLDVNVQADVPEPAAGEVGERVVQSNAPAHARVKHRVREHQLAAPWADIELDHVDPDLQRRVK